MPWDFVLILVVLGILVPWRGAARIRHLMRQPYLQTADRLALYASTMAFQWFAAAVVLWRYVVRRVPATHLALSLGNRPRQTLFIALLLTALLAFTQITSLRRLAQLPAAKQGFLHELQLKLMPQNAPERFAFTALVLTAAICEEFLYRGFVQAVFQDLARGSVAPAVLASAIFFSSAHLYQGKRGLATTFVVGLIFSAIRAHTNSLAPTMLAHFVADLVAGLSAPALVARTTGAATQSREHVESE